jgi:hypothetical protein
LTIGAHDAAGRVKLAAAVNPRRSPVGELLPPEHPEAAAAFTAGAISGAAAITIAHTVDRLPAETLDLEHGAGRAVETVLVDFARDNDPETLRRHAKAVATALDQDGALRDAEYRDRTRELTLKRRADGSGTLAGDLTCQLAEVVETVLDCLGKPQPADDDTRDPRTPGQRRHDALLAGLRLLLGSGRLPSTMGCATTVLLTMDTDAFATGAGVARTGHGYPIPAELAKRWLDPEARAILVLLSKTKGIEAYSSVQRLFTEQQRLAMTARDRGCSYWGCDAPASWSQAHHVTDYQKTRRTRVDDAGLACTGNHHTFESMGWRSIMHNGRPYWVPPTWVDPDQTPRRNKLHDH